MRDSLSASDRMPLVFLGHGSPMNAIEDTPYARGWTELGKTLPRPKAILVVSAHWMTQGTTLVDVSEYPRTIHDFYNFPDELYQQQYPAPGDPALARDVIALLASHHAQGDDTWGLDHGAWSVLNWLYPDADIPVFQLSIDMTQTFDQHLEIGAHLSALRDRGVLILGSGNVVHNLGALAPSDQPHDWAIEFDELFAAKLSDRHFDALADTKILGSLLSQAHPTVDHYLPALTVAGAANARDDLSFMNTGIDHGSISMRSFIFH